ncbi:DNA-binding protein [Burkholderia ubonensis]|uniref:DNA-binding protein n=1 Tax=Burkholderia ubonensis TaxID=101571 RepID=UPI00075AF3C0|nr:DNA-binding protein [Burkholderia ubonensis]KVD75139.1 KfrA protein [Burkholderia ubonensis]KWN87006.1 KfrA protein [Burkholderia ubonensis]
MTPDPTATLDEQALLADIAALRGRCTDTRELYREVCALLFFRYGVTPTANKLYSLVRKGSMGTPADVLNRFWQDLRERTRVKIDHPDLPDAVKQVAAEAVLTIWHSASEASAAELAALRAEARHQAHEAEVARDQAVAEAEAARQAVASTQAQLEAVRAQLVESGDALAAERQAHAATDARLQEVRRQLDEASNQLALVKTELGAEIERARERAEAADTRAQTHEKRALREIDQERTARQKSEQQLESQRGQLAAAKSELKDAAVQHAGAIAALRTELDLALQRADAVASQQQAMANELAEARASLQDALRRAERAEAEVEVTRRLVDGLKKTSAARGGPRTKG